MIGVLSRGIAAIPHLESLLGESWRPVSWWRGSGVRLDKVVGWGAGGPARRARQWAAARGLPYVALEDGFLRSVRLGHEDPPLSIVTDDLGVYFDSRSASRLEELIKAPKGAEQMARAERLTQAWRQAGVSKYNHARDGAAPRSDLHEAPVLVIDQTRDDPSIEGGMAAARDFDRMLEAALDEQPRGPIVVKLHPDVIARRKRGHFERMSPGQLSRVELSRAPVHPARLIEGARLIYVVTSQVGFEALLWGKPVRTFGIPFYGGWGLTHDEQPRPVRRKAVQLGDLVHAGLVDYMRCVDPETGERCTVEALIAHVSLQRCMRMRFPAELHAVDFSHWKKPIVRSFFAGSDIHFIRKFEDAPPHATLLVWGAKPEALPAGRPVVCAEDGFLRSVGLGAELVRPLSWTLDPIGIHYDAAQPSELELLLANAVFDAALLRRAELLRDQLVRHGVTKYNVDATRRGGAGIDWQPPNKGRVILVAGQVEGDASLRHGPAYMRTNLDLLRAVRASAPDAYLIYRVHPDVTAGLRDDDGAVRDGGNLYDEIAFGVPLDRLFDAVHEVHVIASLTGFEALIRGLAVVTHGCPFYAGWGLTEDRAILPRRGRILSTLQLIAGALILYPTYVSRTSGRFTTVERVVFELIQWRSGDAASQPTARTPLAAGLQRLRRTLLRRAATLRRPRRLPLH